MSVRRALLAAVLAVAIPGCQAEMGKRLAANAELRTSVLDAMAADPGLAAAAVDRMVTSDSTRAVVVERLFADAEGARAAMLAIARDPQRFDGVVALAVQDTAMRQHALTLFRGMEMAEGR
jgi:hypothetical protein